jgi:hypothetical protein
MKNLRFVLITLIIVGTFSVLSCRREEFEWLSGPGELLASGTIEVPSGVDQTGWKVLSGLNQGTVSGSKYKLKLNENAVQLISIYDASERPKLMLIGIAGSLPFSNIINASSTAEALVFLNPFCCTSDPIEAEELKQKIRSLTSFSQLVETITSQLQNGSLTISDENLELITALDIVYRDFSSQFNSLAKSESLNTTKNLAPLPDFEVHGLSILEVNQIGADLSFKVANRAKRWITVFVDNSVDGENFVRSPSLVDLIPSPSISIWNIVNTLRNLNLPYKYSEQIHTNTSGYKNIAVKCYGLGVYPQIREIDNDEFKRVLLPATMSAIFDLGIPIFEVISGMKLATLSGSPNSDPFMRLVEKTGEDIIGDAILIAKITVDYEEGDYGKVAVDIFKAAIKQCLKNPSLFAQILAEKSGRAVSRATINYIFYPIRIINACITATNIGASLASIVSTEAVTSFKFEVNPANLPVTIKGIVKSYSTSSPISGANIISYNENGNLQQGTISDANGKFSLNSSTGYVKIRITANGYKADNLVLNIPQDITNQNPPEYYAPTTWLSIYSSETGDVQGKVVDATNLYPISGVTIELRPGDKDISRAVTQLVVSESDGSFHFSSIPSGTYTAYFSKPGYINDVLSLSVLGGESTSGYTMNLSPDIHTTSGYRIILTWAVDPNDLDSHLFTPLINGTRYHVYFGNKGSLVNPPYVNLDVDDVSSYGPETTTIINMTSGEYYYSVYHFAGTGSLTTTSNATISLYGIDGFIRSWTVPSSGDGRWWNVFSLNGETGKITNINEISANPPADYKGMAEIDMKNGK